MYKCIQYYGLGILTMLCFLPAWSWGQMVPRHYFFEGDEVVFEFDAREYLIAREKGILESLDFSDLKIDEVVVSGSFNNWSKDSWQMKQVDKYTYQLRKKIASFNDPFTWDFKFLINGKHWVTPNADNPDKKILSNDFIEETFDVRMDDIEPDSSGNVLFQLKGYEDAHQVILAGSFNNWNERYLHLEPTEDGWAVRIDLPPGRYEYKFIVDGQWMHDPANSNKVRNEHHTFNSVLLINKTVHFDLKGFPEANSVILAGSFNKWKEHSHRMKKTAGGWSTTLELPPGKHYYKYIVDGEWMVDPQNPLKEQDGHGNLNSVLLVH